MKQYEMGENVEFQSLSGHWKPGKIIDACGSVYGVYSEADDCTFIRSPKDIRKVS